MKKTFLFISAVALALSASAQSVSIIQDGKTVVSVSPSKIDAIEFSLTEPLDNLNPSDPSGSSVREIPATWCSVGTSISWYNNNVSSSGGRFTRGYQDRVMDVLKFAELKNVGDNGGVISRSINKPVRADYYTIEHGINDWGNTIPVGTIDDYINNTKNGTFAASYRQLIDNIFKLNPEAKVVLCTPRKAYGFNGYLPSHWYDAKGGIYLKQYADLIKQIAEYESMPVADFFNECGGQHNLDKLSIDVALHPNDDGYQMMANVLIKALEKILVD